MASTASVGDGAVVTEHTKATPSPSNSSTTYEEDNMDDASAPTSTAETHEVIQELAQTLTRASTNGQPQNPFVGVSTPELDPNSGKFSSKAWMKNLVGITSRDPERYPRRTAGVSYRELNVHGYGTPTDYQKTVGNSIWGSIVGLKNKITKTGMSKIQILRDFDGLVKSGEMLVVLGRPGSGCSTLLKIIAGESGGVTVDRGSIINYQGIPAEVMHKDFRGEAIYQAEVDVHFPQLTVGQTLEFAALARTPSNRLPGVTREMHARHMRDVIMATFGLSHTLNTRVGNDFLRGVSGGERKRVSIAEACLGGSPLQCWDNSTRGLDSATALEFAKTLKTSADMTGAACVVAIYQASQSIYDIFDKVAVLYEGRQIYFGNTRRAKDYFIEMGFECPPRQITADFLTSITSPAERIVRKGFEGRTPRTPDEFREAWLNSAERAKLLAEILAYEEEFPFNGPSLDEFRAGRQAAQAKGQRLVSPYTLSVPMQVALCMKRGWLRARQDLQITLTTVLGNFYLALILGSVFYNTQNTTDTIFSRGALLFFAILLAAFSSALEILTLYAQRPIVEKHKQYAFYHPVSEAIASMICDLPSKFLSCTAFSITLYFLANLRRETGAFFFFYLFNFSCGLTMSMIFRMTASVSRTLSQALVPAAVVTLSLVIYTGFVIPTDYMKDWFRWINYLDPVAYAFESLMINEFSNRQIPCTSIVPSGGRYASASTLERVCSTVGSVAGEAFLDGDRYLEVAFGYSKSHKWRNFGILIAMMIGGLVSYLLASEFITPARSKGEVLVFPKGKVPSLKQAGDVEGAADSRVTADLHAVEKVATTAAAGEAPPSLPKQTAVFHWSDVKYDIKIKGEPRRLLDHVHGWVKPGTLTALMGVSGAGKTTLLDVLASRVTMGVVTGQMLVNGKQRDAGFQRKTGYVQQQDLHLSISTVREALNFSALLRQPSSVPRQEKLAYVDEVLQILEMEAYADAVVGVPGEGLNVEQRKRLTIGVELAAKPQLLLFLDEPTSGLDSQTAWSICSLLRKLADNGQAILCTIHQPSAVLFQSFDRLLFLAKGGRTVYFGEIGPSSEILTSYFEKNGSRPCGVEENPAEWMLDVIGAAPGSTNTIDWSEVWKSSPQKAAVKAHLAELKRDLSGRATDSDPEALNSYAASFTQQFLAVQTRVFQQYWRTPTYIYSKTALCVLTALFIGFSFWKSGNSLQGLQNQLFAIFLMLTIFGNVNQQIMPHFVVQRALYEVRERPSKTYSWQVFILTSIFVEMPWNSLMAVLMFVSWYYPIGLHKNAIDAIGGSQQHERGVLMFLFLWLFMMFIGTFTHMMIAGIESSEVAANIANFMFGLCLTFCGVLASPDVFPGFWIFMYRVSPFTYLVDGLLSVGLANSQVVCAANEILNFNPPTNSTCGTYMSDWIRDNGGYLLTPEATTGCQFCPVELTNKFLAGLVSDYDHRWRNFGILSAYVVFNVFAAIGLYWLFRVPKRQLAEKEAAEDEEVVNVANEKVEKN